MTTSDIIGLLIAVLGGAAVGVERQWSGHAEGPRARFAGIRTFTMLGALGGLSGWLWTAGAAAPAAILLAGMGSIRLASGIIALLTLLLVEKPGCMRVVDQCDVHICANQPDRPWF